MFQMWVWSECLQACEPYEVNVVADVRFLKGYGMIRSHISSTHECKVVLQLERFSHLFGRSFGLGSLIGLETLSLVLSLRDNT